MHTASVRRIANEPTEHGNAPLPESAKPHVNSEAKHVPSDAVIVLSQEDEKLLNDIQSTPVVLPVSAAAKRLMGKRTGSQRMRGAKGDGIVFSVQNIPARLFRPVQSSNTAVKIVQELLTESFVTSSNAAQVFAGANFIVNSLDQISHLVALFDQYRIALVELWLVPKNPQIGASAPTDNLATVIDYDDSSPLTTYAQALDYVNVVSTSALMAHYRKFVPHVAVAAYSGAFTSFMNETAPWIDAASPSVQHYGFKVALTQSTSVCSFDLTVRLHTEWRNIR